MSIKRVVCPECGTTANVPASMTSVQCDGCGHVFSPGQAREAAAADPYAPVAVSEDSGGSFPTTLVAAIAIVGVLLVAGFGAVFLLFATDVQSTPRGKPEAAKASTTAKSSEPDDSTSGEPKADRSAAGSPSESGGNFQIVDLPESTRKTIYRDYQKLTASSVGKASRLSEFGKAGADLNATMDQTVKREVTRMSLIHGISEDDIMQIVAEGKAKDW
jgi:hypothetical protein